jgi:hypothetical protein
MLFIMNDSPEAKETNPYQIIGEPVKRPDGSEFSIWEYKSPTNGRAEIEVRNPGLTVNYTTDEVELLGDGDFKRGVVKLGQAYYDVRDEDLHISGEKLLYEKLQKLKDSQ